MVPLSLAIYGVPQNRVSHGALIFMTSKANVTYNHVI